MKVWALIAAVGLCISPAFDHPGAAHGGAGNTILRDEGVEKVRSWQEVLSGVAQKENAALFFDVTPNQSPPFMKYSGPRGAAAMRMLAMATGRTWRQLNGVQTFSRNGRSFATDYYPALERVIAWVRSLNPTDREALLNGTLHMSQIEPETRDNLIRIVGLQDPAMYFVLLDEGDNASIRLHIVPSLQYVHPKLGKLHSTTLFPDPVFSQAKDVPVAGNVPEPAAEPLGQPAAGPLDFGKGSILDLRRILQMAGDAFGVTYRFDGRVAENLYFVSGRLTRPAFEDALRQVTTVEPAQPKTPQQGEPRNIRPSADAPLLRTVLNGGLQGQFPNGIVDLNWTRERLVLQSLQALHAKTGVAGSADVDREFKRLTAQFGPTESMSIQDFLDGKQYTVAQLGQGRPGLRAELVNRGLQPDTMTTLRVGLILEIQNTGRQAMIGLL